MLYRTYLTTTYLVESRYFNAGGFTDVSHPARKNRHRFHRFSDENSECCAFRPLVRSVKHPITSESLCMAALSGGSSLFFDGAKTSTVDRETEHLNRLLVRARGKFNDLTMLD